MHFSVARVNSPPISGKPGQSMVPHLNKCIFVAPDIRAHALEEINGKKICRQNPPMLGRSFSMPLPTITTEPDQIPYLSGLGMSSQAPSPLLLSAPLLNMERPLKRISKNIMSF